MYAPELRFAVMGTTAHIVVVGGEEGLVDVARHRIEDLETIWSRFRANSEVSRLNARSGDWVAVSPETGTLIERAETAWALTGGTFDALVGCAVVALGYDRTFKSMSTNPTVSNVRSETNGSAVARPEVDAEGRIARVPAGASFDPGGIGKGLAADIVVDELMSMGAAGVLVNIGGDLVARGKPPVGDIWAVALDEQKAGLDGSTVLRFGEGAVASSTSLKRTWRTTDGTVHHIVDPATGQNPTGDVVLACVVAGAGWWAEAAATSLVGGEMLIDPPPGCAVLLVDSHGTIRTYGDMDEYVGVAERQTLTEAIR